MAVSEIGEGPSYWLTKRTCIFWNWRPESNPHTETFVYPKCGPSVQNIDCSSCSLGVSAIYKKVS